MDAHPVPQDVNSFQFRLIGDMTIKQFTYLASGLGIAYMLYVFIAASFPFIAYPLILFSAGAGAAFAFLPIADRPLDHWLKAFTKAIFSPTQRRWEVKGVNVKDPLFQNRLNNYLTGGVSPNLTRRPLEPGFAAPLPRPQPAMPIVPALAPSPTPPTPEAEDLKELVETAKRAQLIQSQIVQTEHQLTTIKSQASSGQHDQAAFTKQFQMILDNLQHLTKQAQDIQRELAEISEEKIEPKEINVMPKLTPAITAVPITPRKVTSIMLTETANIINGIVTDVQNSYLDGVIVVAHDKDGLPVRALRTNKLGQFIAATPLPNGPYTMTFEKDSLQFDTLKIELNGNIMKPITVAAKPAPAEAGQARVGEGA